MHARFLLLVPLVALLGAAAACRDSPTAPKARGPSPPALDPRAFALFNDPLTMQLAARLRVTLPGQAESNRLGDGWAVSPAPAVADDSADVVVLSAALQVILDVATTTPPPDSGAGP